MRLPGPRKTLATLMLTLLSATASSQQQDANTGLIIAPGFEVVSVQCTVCHSARIISQNRSDREGWLAMIRWMQDSQGLWPLGDNEPLILDYLSSNYGPLSVGRRRPLSADLLPP